MSMIYRRLGTLMLVIGPVTTLAISPFSNFDPINLVKLLFVTSFAFAMCALFLFKPRETISRLSKWIWIAASAFLVWMLIVVLVSDAPINQQMWGVFGRNTGLLTYASLLLILLGTAMVQEQRTYHKLVDVLVLTGVPTTLYALVQLAGKDPIGWSERAAFATLGNINFSSAFFGLVALSAFTLSLGRSVKFWARLLLWALAGIDLMIILATGSIQGFMIFLAGVGVVGFVFVLKTNSLRWVRVPYLLLGLGGFTLSVLALMNIGPLARFIFQNSILFRYDYWYAGWIMSLKNPLFGVGLDSYGDWYRELRGPTATLRTGPDRITNTAHNIYLDLSASGGFPLLLAFGILLAFAARASYLVLRRSTSFSTYFTALLACWIAYLVQAAVSINQIGVGIWGWLFTGAIIGYEYSTRETASHNSKDLKKSKKSVPTPIPARASLLMILGFAVGLILSFVPYQADTKFKSALETDSAVDLESSAKLLGATAYHFELALDRAIKRGDEAESARLAREILDRYPRSFMAWRVVQVLNSTSPEEREKAYLRLKDLDPYNPTIQRVG